MESKTIQKYQKFSLPKLKEKATLPKKKRLNPEYDLQVICLKWFKMQYPEFGGLIFHIPNERKQSYQAGIRAQKLGVLVGVADVFLSVARNDKHGLYLEFKSKKGMQTESQGIFELRVVNQNFKYVLIRDFEDFSEVIINYLKN